MLTIPIILGDIFFFDQFSHFLEHFFSKNSKILKFSALNANGLEIKLQAQRGMSLLIIIDEELRPLIKFLNKELLNVII